MFEAHITIRREQRDIAKPYAERYDFHMSNITDDEVMGPGPKAYCTRSDPNFTILKRDMDALAIMLSAANIQVQRVKIEAILLDERF